LAPSVPLNRALSKLGVMSRAQATAAIRGGRVSVDGKPVVSPLMPVVPERTAIRVDGRRVGRQAWRTIVFHKPRGVLTTRRDPEGRPTVFDVLGAEGRGLVAVGRLDLATSGLMLLTTDTRLAAWITNPVNRVPRLYLVTVRGRVETADVTKLTDGILVGGDRLRAQAVVLRKASGRESHLTVELCEGKNREVRRLLAAIGHEVTRLKRLSLGRLELGDVAPGETREVTALEIRDAFPGAPLPHSMIEP
jgi:23S rRNA pseudouridine2605 synthase